MASRELGKKGVKSAVTGSTVSKTKGSKGPDAIKMSFDSVKLPEENEVAKSEEAEGQTEENSEKKITKDLFTTEIRVDSIVPRAVNNYKQTKIDQLVRSIKATGNRLINPITVAKISDLKRVESPLLDEFNDKNVDLDKYVYMIVAGERRFSAWKVLREEERQSIGDSNPNKFDVIMANVLKPSEISKEQKFYQDSNVAVRQLTAYEVLLDLIPELDEVKKNEEKLSEAIKAVKGDNFEVPKDLKDALKIYNESKYALYRLETDFGIVEWSQSTVGQSLWVIRNSIPEIKTAILKGEIPLRDARLLASYDEEKQMELLKAYEADKEAVIEEINAAGKKKEKTKMYSREIKADFKKRYKKAKKERKELEAMLEAVSEQQKKAVRDVLRLSDAYIEGLEKVIEGIK